jgi:hypothetical protein
MLSDTLRHIAKTVVAAKNIDVIEAFVLDHTPNHRMATQHLFMKKSGNTLVLVNYSTPIAARLVDGAAWKIQVNTDTYSVTTSAIQNKVIATCTSGEVPYTRVGEAELSQY